MATEGGGRWVQERRKTMGLERSESKKSCDGTSPYAC
jgi:hypothetical protein